MPQKACLLLLLLAQLGLAAALQSSVGGAEVAKAYGKVLGAESANASAEIMPTGWGAVAGVISALVQGFSPFNSSDIWPIAASTGWGALIGFIVEDVQMKKCRPVQVQQDFDLDSYISAPWYPQWQNEQRYQKADELACTMANYTKMSGLKNGWQIDVSNRGRTSRYGGNTSGFLCAKQVEGAKLKVAPCFLPSAWGGPYWVARYNESEGYAIILGGQPNWPTKDGLCAYSDPENNGMWIFTRERNPDEALVARLKAYMNETLKIDTSKMLRTPQDVGCAEWER